jgi:hypothetical protein
MDAKQLWKLGMKKLTFLKKGVRGLGSLIGMMKVGSDLMYALVHFEHLDRGLHRKMQPEELMMGSWSEVRRMGHLHEVE